MTRLVRILIDGPYAEAFGSEHEEMEAVLAAKAPNAQFMEAYKSGRWDGKVRLYEKTANGHRFPAGLVSKVCAWYKRTGFDTEVTEPDYDAVDLSRLDPTYLPGITLRPDQMACIEALLKNTRGIVKSGTGCHRAGQLVMMANGRRIPVEDIRVGDILRGDATEDTYEDGDGSSLRTVLSLCRGTDLMYEIRPVKGEPFVVNGDHVLSLVRTRKSSSDADAGTVVDVTVKEYLAWKPARRHLYKLYRTGVTTWLRYEASPSFSPWLLGILLGDGTLTRKRVWVTTADFEIVSKLRQCAQDLGMKLVHYGIDDPRCPTYGFVGHRRGRAGHNWLYEQMVYYRLDGTTSETKFIPDDFLFADVDDRRALLAGLLDSDGSLQGNCYDFVTKSSRLADNVLFLARSLGLAAYMTPCVKKDQHGTPGNYFRLNISGDFTGVVCVLARKRAAVRRQKKSVLRTGFTVRQVSDRPEPYYGFTLDGNGRYLLGDFTVTHNSGKTEIYCAALRYLYEERGWKSIVVVPKKGLLHQTAERFEKYYRGDLKVGRIGDSIKDPGIVTVATAATLQQFRPYWKKLKGRYNRVEFPADPIVKKLVETREIIALDETHHASSESWFDFCMFSAAKIRWGCSGSPLKDSELSDMRMIGATGEILIDNEARGLVDIGVAAKPKIVAVCSENASGPELPTKLTLIRVGKKVIQRRVCMPYADAYTKGYTENVHHNAAVVRAVTWLVDNGKKTLVLCRKKAHWLTLKKAIEGTGIEFLAVWGDTGIADRNRAKRLLDTGQIKLVLASTIWDEGEDVPGIEAAVFAEGVKANTNSIQRVGRAMRKKSGDNEAWIVDFVPTCHPRLSEHGIERVKTYEGEGYEVMPIFEWPKKDDRNDYPDLLPFKHWNRTFADSRAQG